LEVLQFEIEVLEAGPVHEHVFEHTHVIVGQEHTLRIIDAGDLGEL